MKIKSVKNVDNGTEVVVFLDKNETLDIDMCRKAGKQAEYDAYVIVNIFDGGIIVERKMGGYLVNTTKPNEVSCMLHDGVINDDGTHISGMTKFFYPTFDDAYDVARGMSSRRGIIEGFNTKTGQLFKLEEN